MTYWAREHQANLRRIADMLRELDAIREDYIPALMSDLRDDDHDGTAYSRECLAESRSALAKAMNLIEIAKNSLPEPTLPPLQGAYLLHPDERHTTAHHTMERDG